MEANTLVLVHSLGTSDKGTTWSGTIFCLAPPIPFEINDRTRTASTKTSILLRWRSGDRQKIGEIDERRNARQHSARQPPVK